MTPKERPEIDINKIADKLVGGNILKQRELKNFENYTRAEAKSQTLTEVEKIIDELKTDDEFHDWYKKILGIDDMLSKILDKVNEELKEKLRGLK